MQQDDLMVAHLVEFEHTFIIEHDSVRGGVGVQAAVTRCACQNELPLRCAPLHTHPAMRVQSKGRKMAKGLSASETAAPSGSLKLLLRPALLIAPLPVCLVALPFPGRFFGGISGQ